MADILFTADQNYAVRIPAVVKSIQINHPGIEFTIHLICDELPEDLTERLTLFCKSCGYAFHTYQVPDELFQDAPVNKHYSKAMYYRMLAGDILPKTIDRVLYLDPDLLIINSLMPLWNIDLGDCIFAAASHNMESGIVDSINNVRLDTSSSYFNTGVLLMDLEKCRRLVHPKDIFSMIDDSGKMLLLPDQDVFNGLYGDMTLAIPDNIWNFDVRKFNQNLILSGGAQDEYWIIRNTAVLHFCGKGKPWKPRYKYRFAGLYRHYERLCELDGWKIEEIISPAGSPEAEPEPEPNF